MENYLPPIATFLFLHENEIFDKKISCGSIGYITNITSGDMISNYINFANY